MATTNHESAESTVAWRPQSIGVVEGGAYDVVHVDFWGDGHDVFDKAQTTQEEGFAAGAIRDGAPSIVIVAP